MADADHADFSGNDSSDHHADLDKGGFDSGTNYCQGGGLEKGLHIATEAAMLAGHGNEVHGYHYAPVGDVLPGHPEHTSANAGNNSREVIKSGIANDDPSMIDLTHYFHGPADVMTEIERLAAHLGFEQRCPRPHQPIPMLGSGTKSFNGCLARNLKPEDEFHMPMGWYKNCVCTTQYFRRFYVLPAVPSSAVLSWLATKSGFLAEPEEWRLFLAVSGATWTYQFEVGDETVVDCETRLSFLTWNTPHVANGLHKYDWDDIRRYRLVAEEFAGKAMTFLQGHWADPRAMRERLRVPLADYKPPKPPKIRRSRLVTAGAPTVPVSRWEPDKTPSGTVSLDFDGGNDGAPTGGTINRKD